MSYENFNFKSTGFKKSFRKFNKTSKIKTTPIGIKTPLKFSNNNDLYDSHTNPVDHVKDNLKNLIKTNHGERLGNYFFGANLKYLLYDYTAHKSFDEEVSLRIKNAVLKHMSYVAIESISVKHFKLSDPAKYVAVLNPLSLAKIVLEIKYSIPNIMISGQTLTVDLHAGG